MRRFNKQQSPPDVQKEEWNACSNENSFVQNEVGVRQMGDKAFDFIEKQVNEFILIRVSFTNID